MATSTTFRICPKTGLRIDLNAERLIKANAVAAVVFLAIGGLFGLLVGLTRWPAVHILPADAFYLVLTGHGLDALIVWIIFFEIAVLYFAGSTLLKARLEAIRAQGGNPFFDEQVPQAVIALKQGVGRLIRDAGDFGVVMICDTRLVTKGYGRAFIQSLPPMRRTREVEEVTEFLRERLATADGDPV